MFLNHQTQNFEKFKLPLPLGLLVLPLVEESKIDLCMVDDVTVSNTPPWSQPEPHIYLSTTKLKKIAQALKYINKLFWKLHHNTKNMFRFSQMVSKWIRRLLPQKYHLLPQIVPSHIN